MYPVSKDTSTDSFLPTVNVGENQGAGMDISSVTSSVTGAWDKRRWSLRDGAGWLVSKALAMSQSIRGTVLLKDGRAGVRMAGLK